MRRVAKFFCRAAVLLLLSGLVLCVAGLAMGADTNPAVRWNGRAFRLGWNGGAYHVEWAAGGHDTMKIRGDMGDVEVCFSEG